MPITSSIVHGSCQWEKLSTSSLTVLDIFVTIAKKGCKFFKKNRERERERERENESTKISNFYLVHFMAGGFVLISEFCGKKL